MERVRELRLERPNERQEVFLRDRHKYIAFGGARGGGKSWAGSFGAARLRTSPGDGTRAVIMRQNTNDTALWYPALFQGRLY